MSSDLPGRLRALAAGVRPWQRDAALIVVLSIVGLAELSTMSESGPPWAAAVAMLATTLALAARRAHPLLVAHAIGAVLTVAAVAGEPPESVATLVAVVVAAYTAADAERPTRLMLAAEGSLAVGITVSILRDTSDTPWNIPPTLLLFVVVPAAAGLGQRRRSRAEARRAEEAERLRIARELHDVVAHGVSLIALQADAAEAALERDPRRADAPVAAIGTIAREVLSELRRLLTVLRAPDDDDPYAPRPGAADLPALVERTRRAGLDVDLRVEGTPTALAAGIDLTVYRIAQEALTNALKHSGMAAVAVTLRYGPGTVEVEVTDDGRPPGGAGEGMGLVGMRERVDLYGGRLTAGPGADGGYRVLASVPL